MERTPGYSRQIFYEPQVSAIEKFNCILSKIDSRNNKGKINVKHL